MNYYKITYKENNKIKEILSNHIILNTVGIYVFNEISDTIVNKEDLISIITISV